MKRVELTPDAERLVERQVVPNFRVLGPRLGSAVQTVRQALSEGAYAPDADGRVAVDGHVLEPGEYELRTRPREGFEAVDDGTFVVAIDTQLTPELELEGLARELVRFLQTTRKELGLDISDRIRLSYAPNPRGEELWAAHGEFVAREVLATSVEAGQGGESRFEADGVEIAFGVERAS